MNRWAPARRYLWVIGILLITLNLMGGLSSDVAASTLSATGNSTALFFPIIMDFPSSTGIPTPYPAAGDPVINAVGDIAACSTSYADRTGYLQTAALLQTLNGPVLGLGDYVYDSGTPALFSTCFDPVWGQFKTRMYPAAGNHEYQYPNAGGYFGYFGVAAGAPGAGYYSFDIGAWHIIALNSNCAYAGACLFDSVQLLWLDNDLAAHSNLCTLAFWHHPLYSSGKEGNTPEVQTFWQELYAAHVDVILNGHDHSYERFAPIDPFGSPDPVNGIPEIIVGTGGKDHSPLIARQPNSVVFNDTDFGILQMRLHPKGYDWQFIPVAGGTFTDSGSGICH